MAAAVLLMVGLAGCVGSLSGDARLVDPYSSKREVALFRQPLPFLALYKGSGRTLGYAAVVHSSDKASDTFRLINRSFDIVSPEVVILEGFPSAWGPSPQRITRMLSGAKGNGSYAAGEDAHAARMASSYKASIWGGEPTDAELAEALARLGYDQNGIFFSSMFGPLAQDLEAGVFSGPEDPRFAAAYRRLADKMAPSYGAPGPVDVNAFEAWFEKTYAKELSRDSDWSTRGGPGQRGKAGEIGRASNIIRDRHMFALAMRLLNKHERVLIVYGGSHLSSQWRALKDALGQPEIVAATAAMPARRRR